MNNPDGTLTVSRADSRAEWIHRRGKGIGASESATVLGLNPYKSIYTLWCEKVGLVEPDDLSDNEAVEWGTILEEPVARKYVKVTGRMIEDPGRYTVQASREYPWMIATLDRIILPIDGRGPGALEIKTTGSHHAEEWEDDAPVIYQCQLQHQLVVMGWTWGSLAVLIGGQKFRYIDFERNDDFCSFLIEREREFWRMVENEEPPEVDASDSTRNAIRKLFPKDTGETIALPGEFYEWGEKLKEAKAAVKAARAIEQECENQIKAALGDSSVGLLPDGTGWSWKTQHRDAYMVPASDFRVLREIKGRK